MGLRQAGAMPPPLADPPLRSFVLRVHEKRTVRVTQVYELLDLRSGECRRFESIAALRRFLQTDEAAPGDKRRK